MPRIVPPTPPQQRMLWFKMSIGPRYGNPGLEGDFVPWPEPVFSCYRASTCQPLPLHPHLLCRGSLGWWGRERPREPWCSTSPVAVWGRGQKHSLLKYVNKTSNAYILQNQEMSVYFQGVPLIIHAQKGNSMSDKRLWQPWIILLFLNFSLINMSHWRLNLCPI